MAVHYRVDGTLSAHARRYYLVRALRLCFWDLRPETREAARALTNLAHFIAPKSCTKELQRQELARTSVGVSSRDDGPERCESCSGFHQQPDSRGSQEDVSDPTKIDIREVPVQSHAQERKR